MLLQICQCCGGKMKISSPRNPNICPGCEQLLDDCAEEQRLKEHEVLAESQKRADVEFEKWMAQAGIEQ